LEPKERKEGRWKENQDYERKIAAEAHLTLTLLGQLQILFEEMKL